MMMDVDPAGRTALVTGAGTGVGRAVAFALGRAGARVGLLGRRPDPLTRVAVELQSSGLEAMAVSCDVTSDRQVAAAVKMMAAAHGPIEILVHCARMAHEASLEETTDEDIDDLMKLHLRSAFVLARVLSGPMRKAGYGRIVHVAGTNAVRGRRSAAAHTATQHALAGLTRSLSAELLPHGITVNAVCPGALEGQPESDNTPANPLGRAVTPDEVAAAVLYLTGPHSDAISGQSLILDGGTQPV